jgi:hypothetical protein
MCTVTFIIVTFKFCHGKMFVCTAVNGGSLLWACPLVRQFGVLFEACNVIFFVCASVVIVKKK